MRRGFALGALFLTSFVLAVVLHLNLAATRRLLNRALFRYLDQELSGTVDLGRIDRLDASSVWFSGIAVYDKEKRRVLTVKRLRVTVRTFQALFDWLKNNEKWTLVVDSVWASGVESRLLPTANSSLPSLASAFELDPARAKPPSTAPTRPYRIALSDVVLNNVAIENQLSSVPVQTARFKQLAGLVLITPTGVAVSIKRFGLRANALSNLELQGTGTFDFRSPERIWGELNSTLGGVPFTLRADYRGASLDLNLDAPKLTPEQGRTVLPSWPLQKTASLSVVTRGPLSALTTQVTATVEQSKLALVGTTVLSSTPSGRYSLVGTHIDSSAFFGAGAPSDLSLRARAEFRLRSDSPEFRFDGLVDRGMLLGHVTPAFDFEGKEDASGLILSLRSHDPQLPLRAGLWMHHEQIDLDAQTGSINLASLLQPFGVTDVSGTGTFRAQGKITNEGLGVEAHLTVNQARYRDVSARTLKLETTFEGPKYDPTAWLGQAQLTADGVRTPYVNPRSVRLSADGTLKRARITALAETKRRSQLTLTTHVEQNQTLSLHDTNARLKRGEYELGLHVGNVAFDENAVHVDSLALDGSAGNVTGNVRWYQDGNLSAELVSERLDLGVLGELLELPPHQLSGTANADIALDTRGASPHGELHVAFDHTTVGPLTALTGTWAQSLDGKRLAGTVDFGTPLVERLHGSYELLLEGPLTSFESLSRAVGTVALDAERVKLERLPELVGTLPEGLTTKGTLSARLTAHRQVATQLPEVLLSAVTDGLDLNYKRRNAKPIHLTQSELLGNINYDGTTGNLTSDWVISKLGESRLSVGFASQLDLTGFFTDPLLARSRLFELPFDAWLQLPKQSLSEFETLLGEPFGTGAVQAKLWLKGPLTDPHLVVETRGEQLLLAALRNEVPLDAQLVAEFAHLNGETRVLCGIGSNNEVWAQLNGVGSLFAAPDSPRNPDAFPFDWSGKLEVGFTKLPLEALPGIRGALVSGSVRGGATVTRERGKTTLSALIPIDGLRIQSRPIGQSLLSLSTDDNTLNVTAKLMDGDASVDVEGRVPVALNQPLPTFREGAPLELSAHLTGYDAGILAPVLNPYLSQLEGELNGDLEATYRPATSAVNGPKLALGGKLQLREGRGRLRALDVDLSEVSFAAQASSTGSRTLIHIPKLTAAVGSPAPNLDATVVVELDQLSLKRLGVSITRAEAVPLVLSGITQATLTGKANVEVTPLTTESAQASKTNGYAIDTTIGELELQLPRELAREVVALEDNADIRILQPLGSSAYKKERTTVTPYRIRIDLGKKTRVTRKDFNFPLSGNPELFFDQTLHTSGNLQLETGGHLQLAGKTFSIEHGLVRLNPDEPSNPHFDIEAQWRGPTHLVTATVTGTAKEAELHLSSDPPVGSETQVLALLLSGSDAEVDSTAAGLGVGATIINEFMSETPLSSVEIRTSQDEQHANYTAAVPLKENLWFEGTYQSATNNGLNPSATTTPREGFSGTVDWRFHRNWSLRTEIGTLGAGADLLWQYRYK